VRQRLQVLLALCLVATLLNAAWVSRRLHRSSREASLVARRAAGLDGLKSSFAYATFFGSDDFLPAIQVLLHTLAQTGPSYPLIMCVLDSGVSDRALNTALQAAPQSLLVRVRRWAPVTPPAGSAHAPRWGVNWSKLRLWQLTDYERVLYVDADTMVLRNLDDVFDALPLPPDAARAAAAGGKLPLGVAPMSVFAGTPDWGKWTQPGSAKMNAGVFLFSPSAATFSALLNASRDVTAYRSLEAEQGLLNAFFGARHCCLPHTLNAQKTLSTFYPDLFDMASVSVLHFTGEKPWRCWRRDGACSGTAQLLDTRPGALEDSQAQQPAPAGAGPHDGAFRPVGFADMVDTDDFSELHAMWRAEYLRIRRLGPLLALFDASADTPPPSDSSSHLDYTVAGEAQVDGSTASRSVWPVPLRQLPSSSNVAAPVALLARMLASGRDAPSVPFVGLVVGSGDPPNWAHLHLDHHSSGNSSAGGADCFAWSVLPLPVRQAGHSLLDVLMEVAAVVSPQLPALVDMVALSHAMGPPRGGRLHSVYVRSQAVIMRTPLWVNFTRFFDGLVSTAAPADSSLRSALAELVLNAWLAAARVECTVIPE
jgi:alpha-N-acetylglucosamine transferase